MSHGLVLEGGGMRALFSAGVMDEFMQENIVFDALAGVSAGVLFGSNYKSNQPERSLRYNVRFGNDSRYMSWKSLLKTGDYVNAEFSYRRIPYELDKFDIDAFEHNPMRFFVVCTDIGSGQPVYKEITKITEESLDWMRASASMPLFAKPLQLDGYTLMDGGLSDCIPLQFLQKQGYEKNVVILTQPLEYRKKPNRLDILMKLFLSRYPKLAELMKKRYLMYNAQLDYIENQAKEGKVFIVRPKCSLAISRLCKDKKQMTRVYELGREVASSILPQLQVFLKQ